MTVCASHCPLCGQPNQCARERTDTDTGCGREVPLACWCVTEQFTPELLKQVPEESLDRACVCQSCVRAHQALIVAS